MWNSLYTQNILNSGRQIPHEGRLPQATVSAHRHSALCGATIHVDLLIAGDQVTDFGQEVDACVLGRAAAAFLGASIVGSTLNELRELRAHMHCLLATGKIQNFPQKWQDLDAFQAVYPYPLRHGAVLLPFDAVTQAIDKYAESLKTNG